MKQSRHTRSAAIALLLAGLALPLHPAFAQEASVSDVPVVNAPPPVSAPTPAPPPVVNAAPPPAAVPAPPVEAPEPPAATVEPADRPEPVAERAAASTSSRRSQAAARTAPAEAPAAEARPVAPIAAPDAPPSLAEAPMTPAPVAEPTPPIATEAAPEEQRSAAEIWPWLIGLAVVACAAFAFLLLRRRRRSGLVRDEGRAPELGRERAGMAAPEPALSGPAALAAAVPLAAAAPLAATSPEAVVPGHVERPAEAVASVDRISIRKPNVTDVEALAAGSEAPAGRPWLEFLLRPVRAGTTATDAVVEFELTVGNTGSVPADDVRISTWMFAAGSPAESEMENMLIEPPAEARLPALSIAAGDAARVEAALVLPREGLTDTVLPVVVADARYTLPDGSEGRMSAAFEVGLPGEEALAPFPGDRSSGLIERVEARLHGGLERT